MSVFSSIEENRKIYQGKHFFLIKDGYPVSPGHILIISNKEKLDYFELDKNERNELTELIMSKVHVRGGESLTGETEGAE